jgi:hypothetical protein
MGIFINLVGSEQFLMGKEQNSYIIIAPSQTLWAKYLHPYKFLTGKETLNLNAVGNFYWMKSMFVAPFCMSSIFIMQTHNDLNQ